jgi:hypothetical protein
LYNISDRGISIVVEEAEEGAGLNSTNDGGQHKKWWPVLVEKKQSRRPHDGRSILEIAQDRKTKSNLEENTSMNRPKKSLIVIDGSDLGKLASETSIQLGIDNESILDTIAEIKECEAKRDEMFSESCEVCRDKIVDTNAGSSVVDNEVEGNRDGDPHTPTHVCSIPQVEDVSASHGQWTVVVNKKKSKARLNR